MVAELKSRIVGTGIYLPEKVMTNADFEKIVDTSDEWIFTRTGMRERRIARDDEFSSTMGAASAKEALAQANMSCDEVDLIICATLSQDYIFPSTACLIQDAIGAKNAAAFDIQAACSGFIYALSTAKAFAESGMYKNILIVAPEKVSAFLDYEDRRTCVLFGDGAAAAVVTTEERTGLMIDAIDMGVDGSLGDILSIPAGGSRKPASEETVKNREHYMKMDGQKVFKNAVLRMEESCTSCLQKAGLEDSDISWLVPHQANIRIIDALAKRFSIPREHVYVTVHKYGNTSSSSIGIALHELLAEKEVKPGENLLLTAFGGGLAWGSCVLRKESIEDSNAK